MLEIPETQTWPDRKFGEDNEEKVISRLGITYGVLRRLGFTEERVEECLKAISGVELEEAFDWVRNTTWHSLNCFHHYTASSPLHRGNRRTRNPKIQDWAFHAYRSFYTVTYPPDTPHSGSSTTLSLPSFSYTLKIGR